MNQTADRIFQAFLAEFLIRCVERLGHAVRDDYCVP